MTQSFTAATTRRSAVTAHVEFAGQLDLPAAELLRRIVADHVRAGRRFVRIDASGAQLIEDVALDLLASLAREVRAANGALTMCGVTRDRLVRARCEAAI